MYTHVHFKLTNPRTCTNNNTHTRPFTQPCFMLSEVQSPHSLKLYRIHSLIISPFFPHYVAGSWSLFYDEATKQTMTEEMKKLV